MRLAALLLRARVQLLFALASVGAATGRDATGGHRRRRLPAVAAAHHQVALLRALLQRATRERARGEVDLEVDDDHDDERQVERADGRVDDVADLAAQFARGVAGLHRLRPLPPDERRKTDGHREEPDDGDHGAGPQRGAVAARVHHVRDALVPVDADETEVEDGGGAEEDIGDKPQRAQHVPERPVTQHLIAERERHDERPEQEVADGQRGDEPVLRRVQSVVDEHSDDHEQVADQDHDDDRRDHDARAHDVRQREAAGEGEATPALGGQEVRGGVRDGGVEEEARDAGRVHRGRRTHGAPISSRLVTW